MAQRLYGPTFCSDVAGRTTVDLAYLAHGLLLDLFRELELYCILLVYYQMLLCLP